MYTLIYLLPTYPFFCFLLGSEIVGHGKLVTEEERNVTPFAIGRNVAPCQNRIPDTPIPDFSRALIPPPLNIRKPFMQFRPRPPQNIPHGKVQFNPRSNMPSPATPRNQIHLPEFKPIFGHMRGFDMAFCRRPMTQPSPRAPTYP